MPSSVNAVGLNASVELKVGTTDVRSQSADNAEFEGGVNVGKEDSFVLEVIEPDEAIRFSDGGEEVFGRFVRGDAGGREQADAAAGSDELVGQFGEDGVEIDVASAGERIFSRRAAAVEQGVGGGERLLVALVKGRVVGFELGDQFSASGGVGGGGDFGGGDREEFAFLQLDAFPGWVADHTVEAGFARSGRERDSPWRTLPGSAVAS